MNFRSTSIWEVLAWLTGAVVTIAFPTSLLFSRTKSSSLSSISSKFDYESFKKLISLKTASAKFPTSLLSSLLFILNWISLHIHYLWLLIFLNILLPNYHKISSTWLIFLLVILIHYFPFLTSIYVMARNVAMNRKTQVDSHTPNQQKKA